MHAAATSSSYYLCNLIYMKLTTYLPHLLDARECLCAELTCVVLRHHRCTQTQSQLHVHSAKGPAT